MRGKVIPFPLQRQRRETIAEIMYQVLQFDRRLDRAREELAEWADVRRLPRWVRPKLEGTRYRQYLRLVMDLKSQRNRWLCQLPREYRRRPHPGRAPRVTQLTIWHLMRRKAHRHHG